MSNRTYDLLKWLILIVFPALTTLIGILGQAYSWPNLETTITTMTAITAFLGTITGISNYGYTKKEGK